jgi:ribose-phosphate pyrophosphokinase
VNLAIFACSSNLPLAAAVADRLGLTLGGRVLTRFPDSELHIEIQQTVRGHDVYLIQPTGPPVHEHVLDLLLLADACKRAGTARMTALIPYFGYARQDRRATGREPIGARLVADLIQLSGIERVVAVDLHTSTLEAVFPVPLEHLSAAPELARAAAVGLPPDAVIVSPDLGAVKLAERYARFLNLPVAIVNKTRLSGEAVESKSMIGDVRGRSLIVVDDMISTGGTIEAAIKLAIDCHAKAEAVVVATHGLLVGPAVERLQALPIRRVLISDSVELRPKLPLPVEVVTVAPLLAEAIRRLHEAESLSDLIVHA